MRRKRRTSPQARLTAGECVATYWKSRAFYPLTFPITVGPGSVAVMLTLSAQAKSIDVGSRIPAFLRMFACVVVMSGINYLFCAYAPLITERFSSAVMHDVLRIIAFLLICVGAQIAWHGVRTLISSVPR